MTRLGGLRPRLTLLTTGVVVACVGIAFLVVYRDTSSQLTGRSHADLHADLADLRHVVEDGARDRAGLAARVRRFLAHQPFRPTNHVVFVAPVGGRPISNQPDLLGLVAHDEPEPPATQRAEDGASRSMLTAPEGFSVHRLPDAGRLELLVSVLRHDGRPLARLGVAEPTAANDRARDVLLDTFLLSGGIALAAALAGGFLVASRVAAPLRRMARVASRVDAGELGPRMEIAGRRDEVRTLAESFDHMLDRLQTAFDRQSEFVADASHELRTPLTVIQGQIEVLANQAAPNAADVRHVELLVRTEVDRMTRLVEDMLALAQAGEGGFMRPREVQVHAFVDELVAALAPAAPGRLELDGAPDVTIRADPDRLAQALRNLIRNAVAHTGANGRVRLSAAAEARVVRFSVDDDGPGIPPAERLAVFDRFHRLDAARSRDRGGAGLGLALVRAIAEAHGGRAWAEKSPLGGARLVVELPRTPPARG